MDLKKLFGVLALGVAMALPTVGLVGCDDDNDIEDAMEDAGDNLKDAGNDVGEAVKDAGREIEDAAD